MTADRRSLDDIFAEAIRYASIEDRSAFLDAACGDDSALRERLQRLLRAHDEAGSFLDSPAADPSPTVDQPVTDQSGTQIGPYKLLQQIGEGGFGVVYMAEQSEPVRRKVALKIIKPGMDTKEVIARLEAERQALAMMDHPNIAKIFDAGATDSGRPYIVMELVKGCVITEYCDRQRLDLRERLRLILPVCRGVQHAHQKGIIHRDLKPSNVLVALYDNSPVPKIIDFGVSKAIGQPLTQQTLFTAYGQVVGTLEYMSPEQAQLNQLDVDTRSDIYSLGVLLYELLTGSTPFEKELLRSAGVHEMLRLIREEEPPTPSMRLSASSALPAIAENRHAEPVKLSRSVQGELDWIVMKALEKERSRRYETPTDLARDIEHYLNDAPVAACPPSLVYRLRKFTRRNRRLVNICAGIACALVVAAVYTYATMQELKRAYSRADEAAQKARDEAYRATNFLDKLQEEVIEHTLLCAVAGDIEGTREGIERADVAEVSDSWLLTLDGAAHLHRGETRKAINLFEQACDAEPTNVSAQAMLLIAYAHDGDWHSWSAMISDVRRLRPRPKYEVFDSLFLGYAEIYADSQRAAVMLEDVIERRPAWIVPRAFLGIALCHSAQVSESTEPLQAATRQLEVARLVAPDHPIVLMSLLAVHSVHIEFRESQGLDTRELVNVADDLADKLEAHRHYPPASVIRSNYYDQFGTPAKAEAAFRDLLQCARGNFASAGIAYLVRRGASQEALQVVDTMNDTTAEVKIAKALVLADVPQRRHEALAIYETVVRGYPTYYARASALVILMALGEVERAEADCQNWLRSSDGVDDPAWDREIIEFFADKDADMPANLGQWGRFFTEYAIALKFLGRGEMDRAKSHFQASVDTTMNGPYEHGWAMAFLERMKQDPAWPRGHAFLAKKKNGES